LDLILVDAGLGVAYLYTHHSLPLLLVALSDYEVEAQWSAVSCPEHLLLCRLVEPPGSTKYPVQSDPAALDKLLSFLTTVHMTGEQPINCNSIRMKYICAKLNAVLRSGRICCDGALIRYITAQFC
jgi:hypothetical protein